MDSSNTNQQTVQNQLKAFARQLPTSPGVYCMLDVNERVLYVGKAKSLRPRVLSYFSSSRLSAKTDVLMRQVVKIDVTLTLSECEALLLEANLIKQHRPRYNVLLRDDKSYPYLLLTTDHPFPRLDFHRGSKRQPGRYFGPFPSAGAVRENLNLIQKIFKIRQCSDSFFKNRTRPCLQYQINRCTAPCVNYVSEADYRQQVRLVELFIEGKNQDLINQLTQSMQGAAKQKQYELAAHYRDKILDIRHIQQEQSVTSDSGEVDVFGLQQRAGVSVISVLFVRGGRVLGQKLFYPTVPAHLTLSQVVAEFLLQYYLNPAHQESALQRVVVACTLPDKATVQQALAQLVNVKLVVIDRPHAKYLAWCQLVKKNARHALSQRLSEKVAYNDKWQALTAALGLSQDITRIECFDISHTQGEATVASCVVFGDQGQLSDCYRRFNIKGITPGDDYAAMRQVLLRHYTRLKKHEQLYPDLVIIDGGKGQLRQACEVMEELQLTDIVLLGIAKGRSRKPGREVLYVAGRATPLQLSDDSMAIHLLQQIRDEAHRFAITAHRRKRSTQRLRSTLEQIPGIGKIRRQALLIYFGGFQSLVVASAKDIAKVNGISRSLAEKIFAHLHDQA